MVAPIVVAGARVAAGGASRKAAAGRAAGAARTEASASGTAGEGGELNVRRPAIRGRKRESEPRYQGRAWSRAGESAEPRPQGKTSIQRAPGAYPDYVKAALERVAEIFEEKKEPFDEEDAETLLSGNVPSRPPFPFMIFGLALLLDILAFGIILNILVWVIGTLTLTFWTLGKIHGGWWKKRLIKWVWQRFGLVVILETLSFTFIPANTVFILMAHYKETKIVKLLETGLEVLRAAQGGGAGRVRFSPTR